VCAGGRSCACRPDPGVGRRTVCFDGGSSNQRYVAGFAGESRDPGRPSDFEPRFVLDHSPVQKRPVSGPRALPEAPFRWPRELDLDGGDENDSGPLADLRLMRLDGIAEGFIRGQIAMGLARSLYRAARIANNAETLASGNPKRIGRRAKNIMVGRALGRAGIWRRLWR
jgi:hypothetical protein